MTKSVQLRCDPGGIVKHGLLPHQQTNVARLLHGECDLRSLSECLVRLSKKAHRPMTKLDISGLPHLWAQVRPGVWRNQLNDEYSESDVRPIQGTGMILADTMGMGKTITLLALVKASEQAAKEWSQIADVTEQAETLAYRLPLGMGWHDIIVDSSSIDHTPPSKRRRLTDAKGTVTQSGGGKVMTTQSPASIDEQGLLDELSSSEEEEDDFDDGDYYQSEESSDNDVEMDEDAKWQYKRTKATLIVCPAAVFKVWVDAISRANGMNMCEYRGEKAAGCQSHELIGYNVILTTYDILRNQHQGRNRRRKRRPLYELIFHRVILDEGHKVCSQNSFTRAVKDLRRLHIVIATGTPIQNRLHDLQAYAESVLTEDVDKSTGKRLPNGHRSSNGADQSNEEEDTFSQSLGSEQLHDQVDTAKLEQFATAFMLRTVKSSDKRFVLPATRIFDIVLPLEPTQLTIYLAFRTLSAVKGDKFLQRPRQAAVDPDRSDFIEYLSETGFRNLLCETKDARFLSNKYVWLKDFLSKTEATKIVIFSQYAWLLDNVEVVIENLGSDSSIKILRVQGSDPKGSEENPEERARTAAIFNKTKNQGHKCCVLVSVSAAGEGISLEAGSVGIFLDTMWNPHRTEQAIGRLCRPRKKESVVEVYRLYSGGTIEEQIREIAKIKANIITLLFPDEVIREEDRMSRAELLDNLPRVSPPTKRDVSSNDEDEDEDGGY